MNLDRRRKAVLILECDSARLAQQDLALGQLLYETIRPAFPKNPVRILKSFKLADLLKDFSAMLDDGLKYRTVIIVGHSNRNGLQVSEDRSFRWSAVANFLLPFEPHRLIMLACEAGRWQPCSAMFRSLPTLKEIFASPLPADKTQAMIVVAKTLHVLDLPREDVRLNNFMQIVNFALTRNVMIHHTRKEFEEATEEDHQLWDDLLEPALDIIVGNLRGIRNV